MILASKGYIQLQVKLNDEVRVTPLVSVTELAHSARAIARSVRSILNFHLKHTTKPDKEAVVKEYLQNRGWKIES